MARAKKTTRKSSAPKKAKKSPPKKRTSAKAAGGKRGTKPARAGSAPTSHKAAAKPPKRNPNMGRLIAPQAPERGEKIPPGATLADDPVAAEIVRRLREALTPSLLSVQNLSAAHQKHSSAKKHGGGHYLLTVVSDVFNGLNLMQRQQWIHSLLDDMMGNRKIHALEMKLKNTDETSSI